MELYTNDGQSYYESDDCSCESGHQLAADGPNTHYCTRCGEEFDIPTFENPVPFVRIADAEILEARKGNEVLVRGPRHIYRLTYLGGDEFRVEFDLGVLTANEANVRLLRCI